MTDPLPDRPDLEQLRRQAKELHDAVRRSDAAALERIARQRSPQSSRTITLAAAQLVIAREHGFPSWPQLKVAVDQHRAAHERVTAFVNASVDGSMRLAIDLLDADPDIGRRSVLAAAVLGDADTARTTLDTNATAATAIDDARGWPPLLYACYSRWHHVDPARAAGIAAVVRQLLAAGASPDTNDGGRSRFRSALKGSVEVNNPDVTEVLLDAGANPDLGQVIGEAVGHRDHRCLRLLLAKGARIAATWALDAAIHADDAEAASLLLEAVARSGVAVDIVATASLTHAVTDASVPVIAVFLEAGANPNVASDGVSAIRIAVRAGKDDIAAQLRAAGATDDATEIDRFSGACLTADRRAAQQLLDSHPGLLDRLGEADRSLLVAAAESPSADAVALMLDLGFTPDARDDSGEQALHNAAYFGRAATVQLLLNAGADVDARDTRFDGTPLAFATVGSGEQAGSSGDWVETVRLLLDAGASRQDAWVANKPPSDEVSRVLQHYGIGPPRATEHEHNDDDTLEARPAVDSAIADIALQLEAAYRSRDLVLLASLLHPDVHWTGLCTNREQVIEWYRHLADDTLASVDGVEVDRDAVVIELTVGGRADGARAAPGQHLFQVCTIAGAQIVDIRGYPSRASALSRP
ncbi:MAG: ankyrin repeat domain-containing protein [Candidatus Dormibacteria bacterium]